MSPVGVGIESDVVISDDAGEKKNFPSERPTSSLWDN